jgi:secondary thiamine-phosphate synthase enzyme
VKPTATMRAETKYLLFDTKNRRDYIRITDEVAAFVSESGLQDGMVLVSAMHITAGIYINDWEEGLIQDIDAWLEKLAPVNPHYKHHNTGEDNGDAHLKRLLINHQVIVPVTSGKLDLGPWEQIFYAEFDGQRKKRVILKALGI